VFRIAATRGAEVLVDLLGEVFAGVLCSDRWRPYQTYHQGALQFCWAHFKRNVLGAQELAKTSEAERFGREALALHARLFRLWYRFRGDPAARGTPLTRQQLIDKAIPLQKQFFALGERHLDSRNNPPCLTDRYLASGADLKSCLPRFCDCIDAVLRYRGVGDATVRQAIAIIEARYADSQLKEGAAATKLTVTASALSATFYKHTEVTFGAYLREFPLDRAAALLQSTSGSIKEAWSAVGYNHASNFNHDFKDHFGMTPREYRARVIPHGGDREEPQWTRQDQHGCVASTGGRGRILIVDDMEDARGGLGAWLRLEGYDVVVAQNGREGLAEAARFSPHAVLLDYRLPDMDGIEVLRALRHLRQDRAIGVAIATGDPCIYDRIGEIDALEALVLTKPFDGYEAERTIAYMVAKR